MNMTVRMTVSDNTIAATITMDAQKLWSCEQMRRNHPHQIGSLPKSAGQKVILESPGRTPSPFCSALRYWYIAPESREIGFGLGTFFCEHQLDGV